MTPRIKFLLTGLLLTCLFTLTGYFGEQSWLLDLTSHFRVQYAVFQLAGLLVLFLRPVWLGGRSFGLMAALMIGLLFNGVAVQPLFFPGAPPAQQNRSVTRLRLMHFNVLLVNNHFQETFDYIENQHPDIVALQEVWGDWPAQFNASSVLQGYPYRAIQKTAGNYIYSKFPLTGVTFLPVAERAMRPNWKSAISTGSIHVPGARPLHFYYFHPPVPVLGIYVQTMRNYLTTLQQAVQDKDEPLLVFGDFNTTPWSANYRFLRRELGLNDVRTFFGWGPTWPTFFPLVYLPIDQVMISPSLVALRFETGEAIGSDHLPVIVDLGIPR